MGAGDGRLCYLLNKTGKVSKLLLDSGCESHNLQVTVIPVDTDPQQAYSSPLFEDSPAEAAMLNGVYRMSDKQAIAKWKPAVVLCAWMTVGADWTSAWRAAGVNEYVLIGCLGSGPESYSISEHYDHSTYERQVVHTASSELLTIDDTPQPPCDPGYGASCVMSYRRPT